MIGAFVHMLVCLFEKVKMAKLLRQQQVNYTHATIVFMVVA